VTAWLDRIADCGLKIADCRDRRVATERADFRFGLGIWGLNCRLWIADFGGSERSTIGPNPKSKIQNPKSEIANPNPNPISPIQIVKSQSPISIANQQSNSPIDNHTNPHSPIPNPQCILSL
jgi:hypothetical protein